MCRGKWFGCVEGKASGRGLWCSKGRVLGLIKWMGLEYTKGRGLRCTKGVRCAEGKGLRWVGGGREIPG